MQSKLPLPIGNTDYKYICQHNYYVDKTLLIKDILDEGAKIILFTRPRRFGKTLNMDMLRTFFEKTDEATDKFFTDKKIWQQGEEYTKHQGQYPVIYLSLKDIKAGNWELAFDMLKYIIRTEYSRYNILKQDKSMALADVELYDRIITNTATESDYSFSLQALSRMLHVHYKKAPIIIIDEYDTPIQEGYVNGYYNRAVEFIRNFFSAALKDNPHLTLSILTGILRVAKESIFSGLNNIRVFSVLDRRFSDYFGFTTVEVEAMAAYYGEADKMQELQAWYDGYKFGSTEIFNPWSVLNYFSNDCQPMPYWVQTSANTIIKEILQNYNASTYDNLWRLLCKASVVSVVETNIIYPKLKEPQTNILGFLLMTGYLKATRTSLNEDGAYICDLSIPNKEIRTIYRKEILALLAEGLGENTVTSMQNALLTRDAERLKHTLRSFMVGTISYYDGLKENYYQGLLLGLLAVFEHTYYVHSNRESGDGRYDIELSPKKSDLPGIIIEIKAAHKATELEKLAQAALEQIETKEYATELQRNGVRTIYKYGIAFYKKQVAVVVD